MTLLFLGVDANDRVASVTWQVGAVKFAREPPETFSVSRYREWADDFPYRYGIDDGRTANLFYLTTEQLRLSSLPDGSVTVIADTSLQQFPPNLLRVGDEFAGRTRAMSAVPSLSWLNAARATKVVTNGKMKAWISQREEQGNTLVAIAGWPADTFAEHGIELDTSDEVPAGLAGSDLAIVAAHGGLDADEKFFQRVSDECDLVVSSGRLARALRNVRVAVLFVCSAGRADQLPGAVTTVGLAKRLLDQGCSAVIASPWPLDARVTYQWLPTFLDEWKAGKSVSDAAFAANRGVEKAVGFVPEKCLAMTVFGDPMLKCSAPAPGRQS